MKVLIYLILPTLVFLSSNTSLSQENCKVLIPEIADKYEGKCKKGLAHGKGIAEGKDKYVGRFKNGLPEGKGKYTWSTGDVYNGYWKQGKRTGKGKFSGEINGVDSMQYGIWENNLFVREIIKNPYSIIRTTSVSRYTVIRKGDGNRILFSIMQAGNQSSYSNLFLTNDSGTAYSVGAKVGFENIEFPFVTRVTYTVPSLFGGSSIEVEFEIKIIEPGYWEVTINN